MGGCPAKAGRETVYAAKGLDIPSRRTGCNTGYTVDKFLD